MYYRTLNLIVGFVLLVVSALWCWGVVATIPGSGGGPQVGAAGFPLVLGIILGVLGLVVFFQGVFNTIDKDDKGSDKKTRISSELWAVGAVLGLLIAYAALLQLTGFIIATASVIFIAVGPLLGVWRFKLIIGMAAGFSLGIYLVLGKLLGVYLPYGTLINLAF